MTQKQNRPPLYEVYEARKAVKRKARQWEKFGPDLDGERWAVIADADRYEVSTHGRVRKISTRRECAYEITRDGYRRVKIEYRARFVARLVAAAFVGPIPFHGAFVCHNDGTRDNNHFTNLRWGTPAENSADMVRHGTLRMGSRSPNATIDEDMARRIIGESGGDREVSRRLGVSEQVVHAIRKGRTWRHVSRAA